MSVETLESRQLLAGLPYGALPDDTGEYMLGDVVVTVVLMESTPTLAPFDQSTENWTPATIQDVKTKVEASFDWWKSLLAQESPVMAGDLNFYVDYTHADTPVATGFEPISHISNDFNIPGATGAPGGWMYDFLKKVGYAQTGDFSLDLRAYNQARRLAGTATHPGPADWAFTIFVVNSTLDGDDAFASGGSFARAFSFPGGRMMIVPSGRPASTFAHEMAHQFWALDEYSGSNYLARRGYYDSQNWNAAHSGYVQEPSIMTNGDLMTTAWEQQLQSQSALDMIGWRDSDQDGLFDVLDVPFDLQGVGYYDSANGQYHFQGSSQVRTLPNKNSSGLGSDITINEITRAEYRIDGGVWQTAATFSASSVNLNLTFPVPGTATTVEIRTIDAISRDQNGTPTGGTGASSPIFLANLTRPAAVVGPGVNGFVWNDADGDGVFDAGESGLPGWTVQLVNGGGTPLPLLTSFEPDDYAANAPLNSVLPAASLSALGFGTDGSVAALNSSLRSTGNRVFGVYDSLTESWAQTWDSSNRRLRARFTSAVNQVSLDVIGDSANDYGRLEAYDANDNLLARFTTSVLTAGQVVTMSIERPTADIAYVIAEGFAGSDVLLDNLKFGAVATTKTGAFGQYSLDSLPVGTYQVRATPPATFVLTGDLPSDQSVVLTAGEVEANVDFGAQGVSNPWQNAPEPHDVSNDTFVSPVDALLVINDLNQYGGRQLPTPGIGPQTPPPFLDVSGDGFVSPVDALMVINYLNSGGAAEGPSVATSGGGQQAGATAGSPGGTPDGEDLAAAAPLGPVVSALRRFVARGRNMPAPAITPPTLAPPEFDSVDDALALDVYQAWVRSRDAEADAAELEHDHSHLDDEFDEHDHRDEHDEQAS